MKSYFLLRSITYVFVLSMLYGATHSRLVYAQGDNFDSEEADIEAEIESGDEIQDEEAKKALQDTQDADTIVEPIEEPNEEKVAAPEPVTPEEDLSSDSFEEPVAQPEAADDSFWSAESDAPDLKYEAKLHDIFVNFYNASTSAEEWNTLVGTRASERYVIQQGDNLWDISQTLFGDGNYWPKVWSLNSKIKNPHLISPNNTIKFLLGDESEPPAFTVTETATEKKSEPIDEGESVEVKNTEENTADVEQDEPAPDIPPPLKVSRPVVKKLPPSLPEWQSAGGKDSYDDFGIDYGHRKITEVEDSIPLTSYISETPPEFHGTVTEIEVGHSIASAFQYIYVSMKPGQGEVGRTYLSVANRGRVQSVHSSIKGDLGYSIDILGEIQLVERVEGKDEDINGEMFRALVLKIINPVSVGSQLIDGKIEKIHVSEDGPRSQVVAQIIGGSFFNRRQVYGTESITYLNRGADDGLKEGQVLPIRANRKIRNSDTLVESNVRPIGWLRIVKTTNKFATALVVRAWSDVLSGDLTGSGDIISSSSTAGANTPQTDEDSEESGDLNNELDQ